MAYLVTSAPRLGGGEIAYADGGDLWRINPEGARILLLSLSELHGGG